MAEGIDRELPHCDWVQVYIAGESPSGAKTLDLTTTAGGSPGTIEVSSKNDGTGQFLAVDAATAETHQVGIDAAKDYYIHFTSSDTPPAGSNTAKTYVH